MHRCRVHTSASRGNYSGKFLCGENCTAKKENDFVLANLGPIFFSEFISDGPLRLKGDRSGGEFSRQKFVLRDFACTFANSGATLDLARVSGEKAGRVARGISECYGGYR